MNTKICLLVSIFLSIFSIGINSSKVAAQLVLPPTLIPDPLPLPPPPKPPTPLEDFKNLIRPWYVDGDYNPNLGATLKLGRECNCGGFRFKLDAGVIGGIDPKTYEVNITGAVVGVTIPLPFLSNSTSFVQNENLVSDSYIASSVSSYVMGSVNDPTTIIFGDLRFEESPGFNPWEKLPSFDLDNDGIYVFEDAQVFSDFLDSSLTCVPEPLTILGAATATGFGAFFKHKRKLSESSENENTKDS